MVPVNYSTRFYSTRIFQNIYIDITNKQILYAYSKEICINWSFWSTWSSLRKTNMFGQRNVGKTNIDSHFRYLIINGYYRWNIFAILFFLSARRDRKDYSFNGCEMITVVALICFHTSISFGKYEPSSA